MPKRTHACIHAPPHHASRRTTLGSSAGRARATSQAAAAAAAAAVAAAAATAAARAPGETKHCSLRAWRAGDYLSTCYTVDTHYITPNTNPIQKNNPIANNPQGRTDILAAARLCRAQLPVKGRGAPPAPPRGADAAALDGHRRRREKRRGHVQDEVRCCCCCAVHAVCCCCAVHDVCCAVLCCAVLCCAAFGEGRREGQIASRTRTGRGVLLFGLG